MYRMDPAPPGESAPGHRISPGEAAALREAGAGWADFPTANIIDPDLGPAVATSTRPGDRYVRGRQQARRQGFETVSPGVLKATRRAGSPTGAAGRASTRLRHIVLGDPLASSQHAHERLTKLKALAVLSSDALSSVAYATEQILVPADDPRLPPRRRLIHRRQ